MPKHIDRARKRQKTSIGPSPEKDDEERRLESLLFGVPYIPDGEEHIVEIDDDDEEFGAGKEMQNLKDTDLFFVDDGAEEEEEHADLDDDAEDAAQSNDDEGGEESVQSQPKTRNSSAWSDPSDPPLVSLDTNQHRKLRDAPSEKALSGREYESRLRRQFERINPAPAWARKRRRTDGEGDDVDDLLTSTNGIIAGTKKSTTLQSGTLAIERLRDANQAAQKAGCGAVQSLVFHPSDRVPVLAVGTSDRRIQIFNIDGHTSPLLQTLHMPSLPLNSRSLSFHPSGSQLLITSASRPSYAVFDLQSTQITALSSIRFSSTRQKPENMDITAFSPSGGLLAFAGRSGNLHLVDWASGAGQVVGTMKCPGTGGGGIKSLWWASDNTLASLTGDAEVFLWNVGERRCVRRWKDEGGFRGTGRAMAGSQSGIAVGGNTGVVNVYGQDSFDGDADGHPKVRKAIGNLTTAVSDLKFNHDSQLLAMASKEKKDSMKIVHMPSLTVFGNWPTSSTPLGHVSALDFSAGSEYLAVGNTKGRVLLYHLKDFGVRH